jgi:protein transport protein YIF1
MMRSPPPPTSQSHQSGYDNPYQPTPAQGGSGTFAPNFGGFMTDPTAQMGFQVGKTAMAAGQEYMEQNVRHGTISYEYERIVLYVLT